MRSKSVLAFAVCFGTVVGFVAAGFVTWSPAQADDEDEARLYVTCPKHAVQPIVDVVVKHGGQVHDMDTFERLQGTQKTPPQPPLQSAPAVMQAVYAALDSAAKGADTVRVAKFHVRQRSFALKVRVSSFEVADAVRAALEANAYLKQRMGDAERIQMGASKRGSDDVITQDFSGRFRESVGEVKVPAFAPDLSISVATMERVASKSGMVTVLAGGERRDPNRQIGIMTVSRDFTYEPTELANLHALLEEIAQLPHLTAIDVRFEIDEKQSVGDKLRIGKSIVKVARYAPLTVR